MRYTFSVLIFLLINIIVAQNDPGATFGGTANELGFSLCSTNDGGYLLGGSTRSYGSGSYDFFLVKLNQNYQTDWTEIYGHEHQDFARSVINSFRGYAIIGDIWKKGPGAYDIYVRFLDETGKKIRDYTYGTPTYDFCFKGYETSADNLLLIGYSRYFDNKGSLYLIMTDPEGNVLWENDYGWDYDEYAMDVIEDGEGSFLIIGSKNGFFDDVHANYKTHDADMLLLKINAEGKELWMKNYGGEGHDFGYSIEYAAGGYYLFGSTQSYGQGSFDMILTKVDYNGKEEWITTYGGENYEYGVSIDKNYKGELYMLGSTKSFGTDCSTDIFLVKSDAFGNEIWSLTIGGAESDFGHQVIATEDNGCAIIATTESFGNGSQDMLFVKINSNGAIEQLINTHDIGIKKLAIAPNPLHDNGRLNIQDNNDNNYTLQLSSLSGVLLQSYELNSSNSQFSISTLPSGMYIYKVINQNSKQTLSGKLVIY